MSVLTQHGKKERVMKCVEVINDMSLVGGPIKVGSNATVPSVPQSPIGVLDAACFSYKSIKEVLVVALEKVERSSGSLIGSSIASIQKSAALKVFLFFGMVLFVDKRL